MANKIPEAAKFYAQELPVLEQARQELFDALDDLWKSISEEVMSPLKASGTDIELGKALAFGSFGFLTSRKLPAKLKLRYRDMRRDLPANHVSVGINASGECRLLLRKNDEAFEVLRRLCRGRGLEDPDIKKSRMIQELMEISLDDPESAVETISERIIVYFEVITEFEKWQIEQTNTGN